ncbi:MAG: hypothetical protein ABGZ17_08410 [Planctomycetaceae bacterium]
MGRHRIQLRGPWQFEWLRRDGDAGPFDAAGRVKLPEEWAPLLTGTSGQLRLMRRFGRPANLEPQEQVQVYVEGIFGRGQLLINGRAMIRMERPGTVRTDRIWEEITPILTASNHLEIVIEFASISAEVAADGLWSSIGIEMIST